jgi:hypothetical protein
MNQDPLHLAEHDVTWLAIRQPAVLRLLERELGSARAFHDGDAFCAGLALACELLGARSQVAAPRLDHHVLAQGLASVRAGRCDRAMVRSIRDQIDELPVVLTLAEQDAVATVIAAVIWAVLDSSVRSLDDMLVA